MVAALVGLLQQREHWLRNRAIVVTGAGVAVTLYLSLSTDSFGGDSFGPRWFLPMVPLLFFFAASPQLYRSWPRRLVFATLGVLSAWSAWQGALDPWRDVLPPLRLEAASPIHLRPQALTPQQIAAIPQRLDVTFEDKARLLGYAMDTDVARPGGRVAVTLYWQALAPLNDDYVVFIHLVTPAGTLAAQRDSPSGVTNQSTRYWKPGDVFSDTYYLDIGETAYTPDDGLLRVGLYLPDGPRLAVRGPNGQTLGDSVSLAPVRLMPRPGTLPNTTDVNWGNDLVLLGYDVNSRVIQAGDVLSVTLYWQAFAPMEQDYGVFTHLTDVAGTDVAKNDGLPYSQPKRTSRWVLGQTMQEVRPLQVPADAPGGLYNIQLGLYGKEGRLPIVASDSLNGSEQLTLVQVRVVGR
jgi:hypothetical protein